MAKEESKEKNLCEAPKQNAPRAVMRRLIAGNKRYVKRELKCFFKKTRQTDKDGQAPYAAILSCADSRVIPEKIFDAGPGELFVARVAGNIATDDIIASIEYAVTVLGTRVIVVLGHQNCGAVDSAISFVKSPPVDGIMISTHVSRLLQQIIPAVLIKGSDACKTDVILENARLAGIQLHERSEILRLTKRVSIYYGYYNLQGKVEFHHDLVD